MTEKAFQFIPNKHAPLNKDSWDDIPVSTQRPGIRILTDIPTVEQVEDTIATFMGRSQPAYILADGFHQKSWAEGAYLKVNQYAYNEGDSNLLQIAFLDNPQQEGYWKNAAPPESGLGAYANLNTKGAVAVGVTEFYLEIEVINKTGDSLPPQCSIRKPVVFGYHPDLSLTRVTCGFRKDDHSITTVKQPLKDGINKFHFTLNREDLFDPAHNWWALQRAGNEGNTMMPYKSDTIFLGFVIMISAGTTDINVIRSIEYKVTNFKMARSNYENVEHSTSYYGDGYYTRLIRDETDNPLEKQVMYHNDTTIADHLASPRSIRVL